MAEKVPVRVTISQAANLFGVNEKTIRRAIAGSEVIYIVVRGIYKINFESLLKWSQSRPKLKNKLDNEGIGQFVGNWKIKNKLYSPNPETAIKSRKPTAVERPNRPKSIKTLIKDDPQEFNNLG